MPCSLEPFGQFCIGFLTVQCCPKSITTILNRVFSYVMFSAATRTKLHRLLTCAVFKTTLSRIFSDTQLSGAFRITLHKFFNCAMLSQEY